jgi:hypothetical protein
MQDENLVNSLGVGSDASTITKLTNAIQEGKIDKDTALTLMQDENLVNSLGVGSDASTITKFTNAIQKDTITKYANAIQEDNYKDRALTILADSNLESDFADFIGVDISTLKFADSLEKLTSGDIKGALASSASIWATTIMSTAITGPIGPFIANFIGNVVEKVATNIMQVTFDQKSKELEAEIIEAAGTFDNDLYDTYSLDTNLYDTYSLDINQLNSYTYTTDWSDPKYKERSGTSDSDSGASDSDSGASDSDDNDDKSPGQQNPPDKDPPNKDSGNTDTSCGRLYENDCP